MSLTLPHSLSFPDFHFRWCMEYLLFYLSCLFDLFCHRLRKDSLSDNKLCIPLINIIVAKIFWVFSVSRTAQTCAWSYPSSFPFHFSFRTFCIDVVLGAIHCSLITVSVSSFCVLFFFFFTPGHCSQSWAESFKLYIYCNLCIMRAMINCGVLKSGSQA